MKPVKIYLLKSSRDLYYVLKDCWTKKFLNKNKNSIQ